MFEHWSARGRTSLSLAVLTSASPPTRRRRVEITLKLCHALVLALAWPASVGADPNPRLPCASGNGDHDTIASVPAAGAVPNVDVERVTPFHFAARKGRTDAVHSFFLAGADPNAKDSDGRTHRDYAATEGHADTAETLPAANSISSTTSGTGHGDATESQRRNSRTLELKDTHGFNQFTLIFDRTKVAIDGNRIRLNLTRRKCNAHVIDRFNTEMAGLIKEFTRKYSAGFETTEHDMMDLRIRIDGKNFVWSDSVRTGRLFLRLPGEIHRMKLEEWLNCSRDEASGDTRQRSASMASFLRSRSCTASSTWHKPDTSHQ